VGRKLGDVYQSEWLAPGDEREAQAALAEGGRWRGENVHVKRDGERIVVESSVSVLRGDDGQETGLLAVIRDVTERVQMEAERQRLLGQSMRDRDVLAQVARTLEQERNVLDTIMEHTETHLAYLDPAFNFVRVNAAYARGSGYRREELIGRNHFHLFPHPENQAIFQRVRDTGQAVTFRAKPFVYPERPELGTTYWDWTLAPVKDEGGRVQGLVFSLTDVTERERDWQEREARLARMRTLIDVSEWVLAETSMEGILNRVVDAARELTGARLGTAGHGYREGSFQVGATSRTEDAPPCPPGELFAVEQGGVYMELIERVPSIRLTDEEMRGHPAWRGLPPGHTPLRGLLGARFVESDGRANGLIMVSDKVEGDFTAEDEALLTQLAALTSLALSHVEARQGAEQRAAEREAVFEAMAEAVVVYDADGIPVQANAAAAQLYGRDPVAAWRSALTREVALRTADGDVLSHDNWPLNRALRGERVDGERLLLKTAWGEERILLASAMPVPVGDKTARVVEVWHDVTEHARLAQENRSQRQFLEHLLEVAPVGVAVVSGPDHRFEFVNRNFQLIPGTGDLPMVGRPFAEVLPNVAEQVALELLDRVYRTGEVVCVREHAANVGPGREETYWDVDCVPLRDDGGEVRQVLIVAHEVTEQVLARQRLQEERAKLGAIIENAPEGIVVVDGESRITLTNPAADRLYGRPVPYGEGYERHAELALCHPDGTPYDPRDLPLTRSALDGETHGNVEMAICWPDGGQRELLVQSAPIRDGSGQVTGAVGMFQDITARVRAEREVESVARFPEENPSPVLRFDGEGTVLYTNPSGRQLLHAWGIEVGGVVPPRWQRAVARTLAEGVETTLELAIEKQVFSIAIAPVVSGGYVNLYGHNITARKRAQRTLRRYTHRLKVLHQADQAVLAARSVQETADAVLPYLCQLVPCVRADVVLLDLDEGELSLLATYPDPSDEAGLTWRLPAESTPLLEELRQGRAPVEDLAALPLRSPWVDELRERGVRAYAFVPMRAEGEVVGTLALGLNRPRKLSAEEGMIGREIADQLAVAVRQAKLREQLRAYAEELEERVRRRTAALRASEARFRAVFEAAAVGIAVVDEQALIQSGNPALSRILGYDWEELAGRRLPDLVHADGSEDLRRQLEELVPNNRHEYRAEQQFLRRDGGVIDAELAMSSITMSSDLAQHAVVMINDVTERNRAQEALIEAEKLALTGRLAASLAHEINNPLQAVIGCLGLAEESLAEEDAVNQYVEIALEELERAAGIVAQLRDLNRPSYQEQRQRTDVVFLLERMLVLTRKRCQSRGVEVEWEAPEDLPPVMAAGSRIQQVFLNIILNAVDAMPEGGQLQIQVEPTERPAGVRVSFADTGLGIDPDTLAHLFEPFHTTRPGGLGLGLYVSKNIVEAHLGRIEVESRAGRGTTFRVWLPLGEGGSAPT
jgi:PAS domain S-box-containing protein